MKSSFLFLAVIFSSKVCLAQFEKVDGEKIKMETSDKNSLMYYPVLIKGMSNDSAATKLQLISLQYVQA